jgi:DNA (cytosine-5)-methyltransferase 1
MEGKFKKSIKIFSFFSGIGFLDLGFEKAGFEICFVNEVHKPFLEAYKYSRQCLNINEPQYGFHLCSIETFLSGSNKSFLTEAIQSEKDAGNVVGFIGGPPCPDFSIGGKNRGEKGVFLRGGGRAKQ